ncbi:MAG: YbjN domain-containing protein [Anaerolineae bacterium]|nr:YbjN domain-containing protein [Anaerolineae bacterium]
MDQSTLNGRLNEPDPGSENANGRQGFITLGQFLTDDGWHPQPVEGHTAYHTYFRGRNGETHCFARVRSDLEQVMFYVMCPVKAPESAFASTIEFITRANYGLRIGNFEFDYSDGEIRYKSSLDFEKIELTPQMIKNMIYPAVSTMDRYLPGLMGVMYGGKSAEEAIAEIEQ